MQGARTELHHSNQSCLRLRLGHDTPWSSLVAPLLPGERSSANESWRIRAGLRQHNAWSSKSAPFTRTTRDVVCCMVQCGCCVQNFIVFNKSMMAFEREDGSLHFASRHRGMTNAPLSQQDRNDTRAPPNRMTLHASRIKDAWACVPFKIELASMSLIIHRLLQTNDAPQCLKMPPYWSSTRR